jgi:hypothetical protein
MLSPLGVSEKVGRAGLELLGSCSLKHSFLLVDYYGFTLVIGPIVIAEKNAESQGSVREGRGGGAGAGGQPAGGGGAPGLGGVAGDQDTAPRHAIRIGFLFFK